MGGTLEQAVEQAILKSAKRLMVKQILTGVAKGVTETTCTVERDNAPALFDVRLNAVDDGLESYVTVYPAEGSAVLVAIIEGMKTEAVVVRCSEVERVKLKLGDRTLVADSEGFVFNDGEDGLVRVAAMVDWMRKVSADLNTLKGLLASSAVAGNGAPLAIVFNPTAPSPDKGMFEDEGVRH